MISIKRDLGHINNRNLICCVYFCSADAKEKEDERLNVLIRYSIPIIPVVIVDCVSNISKCLPTNIRGYNAICSYSPTSKKELMDSILVYLGLIREKRKIFISFSRKGSSEVAMQLFLEFSKRGYIAFLDTVSVDKGADIQEKIFHEITDSDLVIMLDTIGYSKSEWCRDTLMDAVKSRGFPKNHKKLLPDTSKA